MSFLAGELSEFTPVCPGPQIVTASRLVDAATRLHAWSIPMPLCMHGLPLDQHCDECDAAAPLDRPADQT
jgi:hypothetical protein